MRADSRRILQPPMSNDATYHVEFRLGSCFDRSTYLNPIANLGYRNPRLRTSSERLNNHPKRAKLRLSNNIYNAADEWKRNIFRQIYSPCMVTKLYDERCYCTVIRIFPFRGNGTIELILRHPQTLTLVLLRLKKSVLSPVHMKTLSPR